MQNITKLIFFPYFALNKNMTPSQKCSFSDFLYVYIFIVQKGFVLSRISTITFSCSIFPKINGWKTFHIYDEDPKLYCFRVGVHCQFCWVRSNYCFLNKSCEPFIGLPVHLKNWDFSKWVQSMVSVKKLAIFPSFSFKQKRSGKCTSGYYRE